MVYAKQNDIATRYISASLMANGAAYDIPAGTLALLTVTKPDGTTTISFDGTVIDANTVTAIIPDQALSVAGKATAEIQIIKDDNVLTSFAFNIFIETSAIDQRILSSNDLRDFVEAVSHLHDHEDAMLESVFNLSGHRGQVAFSSDFADRIIATGTVAGFNFIVRESGRCDMYTIKDFGEVSITTANGSIFIGNTTPILFLSVISFQSAPTVFAMPQNSGYGIIGFNDAVSTSRIPALTLFKPVSGTVSDVQIAFYVSGIIDVDEFIQSYYNT